MPYVFRFHEGSDLKGWGNSHALRDIAINAIEDPDGAHSSRDITSIPSPFARIDLVKTAFKEVSESELEGNTIYHKLVSDALDIGQILFNYDKYKNEIELISWDKSSDLKKLIDSNNPKHKLLGESLRLYLEQDASMNNFDELDKVYLLNYKRGPQPINIIGGTSPATLFFTSANKYDLSGFQEGSDKLFDDQYEPLNKRDPEYIKYIFSLRENMSQFSSLLPEFNDYLDLIFRNISNPELKDELRSISSYYDNLPDLNLNGGGEVVKILGLKLKKVQDQTNSILQSDFRIKSDFENNSSKLPLVLPNDIYNENLRYTTSNWSANNTAPHWDSNPIEERILPYDGNQYPYLTISDFLEPVIIRLEYPMDSNKFKVGGKDSENYLFPLKREYFKYFSADTLDQELNGLRRLEIKPLANDNVQVILRVPIQGDHFITYRRTYYNPVKPSEVTNNREKDNKGWVSVHRLNMGITPFYKFNNEVKPEYNVAFYDADFQGDTKWSLEYFDKNNTGVNVNQSIQRRSKQEETLNMWAYLVENNFAYIRLNNGLTSGVLVPIFQKLSNGVEKFSFAIDFGTTNTHIEYAKNGGNSQSFELSKAEDDHYVELINSREFDETYLKIAKDDLVPDTIMSGTQYDLPQRTSVAYHRSTNFSQPLLSMGNITIPFKYEKESFDRFTEVRTNLKWDNSDHSKELLKVFFEQLIKMIRNKVLLNNGKLSKTEIVWSYPASMSMARLNRIEEELRTTIHKYLGADITIDKVCESLTPFYYYVYEEGRADLVRPSVSVDIGGGTTDVAIYKENKPILFTSYRFAGDAIFGDNYNRNININGFVQKYFNEFEKILRDNNETNLSGIIQSIKERQNSNDAINALFSLENNHALKSKNLRISFLDKLKYDNDFKIIFLLFFLANIYHIAQIFKAKNLQMPKQFAFSGTASKLLSILDGSPDKNILQSLIRETFKDVLGTEEETKIDILWAEQPKELSSKGGLHYNKASKISVREIQDVLLTKEKLLTATPGLTYAELNGVEKQSLKDFNSFLNFFFELDKKISYKDHFEISSDRLSLVREILDSNKENALLVGLQHKKAEIGEDGQTGIDETLFFYPLTGTLGEMAYKLYKN